MVSALPSTQVLVVLPLHFFSPLLLPKSTRFCFKQVPLRYKDASGWRILLAMMMIMIMVVIIDDDDDDDDDNHDNNDHDS